MRDGAQAALTIVRAVRSASRTVIQNDHALQKLLATVGIDAAMQAYLSKRLQANIKEQGLQQTPNRLSAMLRHLAAMHIKSFVEVEPGNGLLFVLVSEYLRRVAKVASCYVVSLGELPEAVRTYEKMNKRVKSIEDASEDDVLRLFSNIKDVDMLCLNQVDDDSIDVYLNATRCLLPDHVVLIGSENLTKYNDVKKAISSGVDQAQVKTFDLKYAGADAHNPITAVTKPVITTKASMALPADKISASTQRNPEDPSSIYVWINTYNRPDELKRLLGTVYANAGKHRVTVQVYDDGSSKDYSEVLAEFPDVRYTKTAENHGKPKYWKLVTQAMTDIRHMAIAGEVYDYYVKLDDDTTLVDGFFQKCIDLWEAVGNDNKIALNILVDSERRGKSIWTGHTAKLEWHNDRKVWNCGWVDNNYFVPYRFFEALRFSIRSPSKRRFYNNKNASSGTGQDISTRLYNARYAMYAPADTLVEHGDHESVMHGSFRAGSPLIARRGENTRITASLATIPRRVQALQHTVQSLLPQVDELQVYCNGFGDGELPAFLYDDKITIVRSEDTDFGDRGDAGKFYRCGDIYGYRLICDDDVIYPSDYAAHMLSKIEAYHRRAVVGVHGVKLLLPITDYYSCRKTYHLCNRLESDTAVHLFGTNTTAYHTDTITLTEDDFPLPNMADIWLYLQSQKQKVPMVCVSRKSRWVKDAPGYDHKETIYYSAKKRTDGHNADTQTEYVNTINDHVLYAKTLEGVW